MIKINFLIFMSCLLSFCLLLVVGHWMVYNYFKSPKGMGDAKYLQQCPFCSYLFFHHTAGALKVCPRCQSYLEA